MGNVRYDINVVCYMKLHDFDEYHGIMASGGSNETDSIGII